MHVFHRIFFSLQVLVTMSDAKPARCAGESDEAFPETFTTIPPQPAVKKPGQLTDQQLRQYFDEGFIVVEDFFDKDLMEKSREDMAALVDDLAHRMHKAGLIKNLYQEYGLFKRLTMMEKEYPGTTIIMVKAGYLPPGFQKLWADENLLNIIEQVIGPDIIGNPVWTLRPKTPENEATTVPWHQDNSYFENEAYKSLMPTVWIPLLDANVQNGCLQFVRGGHRPGKICRHQVRNGPIWYTMLTDEEMEKTLGVDVSTDVVTVPVKYGGFVMFNNMIPHRSLNNLSDDIRWSLDFRFTKKGDPLGFFGLKDGVVLRKSDDPNHVIDWEPFNKLNRCAVQQEAHMEEPLDEFDTTVHGPWVERWETVYINTQA